MWLGFCVLTILFAAMAYDLRSQKIPLWLTVGGFFLVLVTLLLTIQASDWSEYFLSFGLGCLVFYFFWKFNLWGGGDAKLMMVAFLSVPLSQFWWCLMFVFIAGGLQAGGFMVYYYWFQQGQKITHLPYAVAIFGGYLVWFIQNTI
jgi:Flp pilus assembly protein protease CpaA